MTRAMDAVDDGACPYGWQPYATTSSQGTMAQCDGVFAFGSVVIVACVTVMVLDWLVVGHSNAGFHPRVAASQLLMMVVALIGSIVMVAMTQRESTALCNAFQNDAPTTAGYSSCQEAIDGYADMPEYASRGVSPALYTYLFDVNHASLATVAL